MHVNLQLANAVTDTIRTKVPALAEVYRYGVPPTGRRRYPVATVIPDAAQVDTQLSGNRRSSRAQTRVAQVGVAIRDLKTDDGDFTERLFDIAAAVEAALAGWDVLPIDDVTLTGMSEVQDLDHEGRQGVHAGIGLVFEFRFTTVEGDPTTILEPDL